MWIRLHKQNFNQTSYHKNGTDSYSPRKQNLTKQPEMMENDLQRISRRDQVRLIIETKLSMDLEVREKVMRSKATTDLKIGGSLKCNYVMGFRLDLEYIPTRSATMSLFVLYMMHRGTIRARKNGLMQRFQENREVPNFSLKMSSILLVRRQTARGSLQIRGR